MKTVLLTCEALEPLVLTDGSAESMAHECLGYIPGNMLLGAMAVVWKQLHRGQNPDESPQFSRLFLSGDVAWGHALPACAPGPAMPIPASYRHDKDHDALPPEGEAFEPGEYWVANILTLRDGPEPPSPWQNAAASRKLRRLGQGFMNPATLHRLAERRVFNIHVALGEQRCARDGQLYGYSALARGTRLISRILCRSAAAAEELLNLAR
ncbi:MAG: hypothetical protein HDQ91_04260, partial [Desulfovibrio sp.]|nr:hypothetical protein [Desulfovibrio sp.]